jgi:hypothetical protein
MEGKHAQNLSQQAHNINVDMEANQKKVRQLLSTIDEQLVELLARLEELLSRRSSLGAAASLATHCGQLQQFLALFANSTGASTYDQELTTHLERLLSWLGAVVVHFLPPAKRRRTSYLLTTAQICGADPVVVHRCIQELYTIRVSLQECVADHVSVFLQQCKANGDIELEKIFNGQDRPNTCLGGGAFGSTYRMEYTPLGCLFAVKRIDLTRPIPQQYLSSDALQRECAILESLRHHNIARSVNSYNSDPGRGKYRFFNVVMELIEGGTLAAKVTSGPDAPSEPEVVEWARQTASALSYMHSNHIYHRDLTPNNVMLTSSSTIKIIDLGLACQNDSFASLKVTLVGSPPYGSYEKTTGAPYDGRDDVWAMGLMFLELLKGERYVRSSTQWPLKRLNQFPAIVCERE